MALSKNFYIELIKKDEEVDELAKKGLLNIYNLSDVKEFYEQKKKTLLTETFKNENMLLNNVLEVIEKLIKFIDDITLKYRNGKTVDASEVSSKLFLNVLTNNILKQYDIANQSHSKKNIMELDKLKLKKQILNSLSKTEENYDYDDEYYNVEENDENLLSRSKSA